MTAAKIADGVYWVGVQDPNLKCFDIIMPTKNGTTYNAYLIKGKDKSALIDTVKENYREEYISNIKSIIDLSEIKYLIINHTEPDHSGSVEQLMQIIPDLKVIGSGPAMEFLPEICNHPIKHEVIKSGMDIDLGGKSLKFISALLLHWPDNIYTYLKEDKILFSGDSFGSHYADERLFNDDIGSAFLPDFKNYFNSILGPFKPFVLKAVRRLSKYDLNLICPAHGPILRKNIPDYLAMYEQWASSNLLPSSVPKITIAYVSAYGYTQKTGSADCRRRSLLWCFLTCNVFRSPLDAGEGSSRTN